MFADLGEACCREVEGSEGVTAIKSVVAQYAQLRFFGDYNAVELGIMSKGSSAYLYYRGGAFADLMVLSEGNSPRLVVRSTTD